MNDFKTNFAFALIAILLASCQSDGATTLKIHVQVNEHETNYFYNLSPGVVNVKPGDTFYWRCVDNEFRWGFPGDFEGVVLSVELIRPKDIEFNLNPCGTP